MQTVLAKLDSIETLLTQLVDITQAIEEQPAPKRVRYENVSESAFGSVVQVIFNCIKICFCISFYTKWKLFLLMTGCCPRY